MRRRRGHLPGHRRGGGHGRAHRRRRGRAHGRRRGFDGREGAAMHYTDIAEKIASTGLRKAVGATPAATVSATITTSLNNEGERSPFQRVARGEYILRSSLATSPRVASAPPELEPDPPDEGAGPIQALGMFWDRAQVRWTSTPMILGRQQIGADAVDMAGQRGIYLLHDVREVVYVGRCTFSRATPNCERRRTCWRRRPSCSRRTPPGMRPTGRSRSSAAGAGRRCIGQAGTCRMCGCAGFTRGRMRF